MNSLHGKIIFINRPDIPIGLQRNTAGTEKTMNLVSLIQRLLRVLENSMNFLLPLIY